MCARFFLSVFCLTTLSIAKIHASSVLHESVRRIDGMNDTDRVRRKYSEKNLSECRIVRHKSHTDAAGIQPGPPCPCHGTDKCSVCLCVSWQLKSQAGPELDASLQPFVSLGDRPSVTCSKCPAPLLNQSYRIKQFCVSLISVLNILPQMLPASTSQLLTTQQPINASSSALILWTLFCTALIQLK